MALDVKAAIDRFWQAHRNGEHFPSDWHDRLGFDEAYRIQLGVMARRVEAGERQVGWKVAQTSEAARLSFGFAEPLFGCIMQDGVRRSRHVYRRTDLIRPRCEPELCVRLGRSLSGTADADAVRRAVTEIHPAFEIIEVRGDIAAQKALAIADNAATKDIVLGAPTPFMASLDLAATECRVALNGEQVAQGRGAAVLDDPLNAVVWLARKLAAFGVGLREGDIVMTGSMTRALPLAPGDRAQADFGDLGVVEVGIADRVDAPTGEPIA